MKYTAYYGLVVPFLAAVLCRFLPLDVQADTHTQQHQNVEVNACGGSGIWTDECPYAAAAASDNKDFVTADSAPIQDVANDDEGKEDEEEDPMLKPMPGMPDFKAYVRADIATFYQKPPGTMTEQEPSFDGQAGKFVNLSPNRVALYWVSSDDEKVLMENIGPWGSGGQAVHLGHEFVFTPKNKPDHVLCYFTIVKGTSVYYYDPYDPAEDWTDPARGEVVTENLKGGVRPSLDKLKPADRKAYQTHKFNLAFGNLYKNFTGGSEWLTMYPRDPPRHKMWRADYFGQTHTVLTAETHFHSLPADRELHKLTAKEMRRVGSPNNLSAAILFPEHRAEGPLNLTLKVLSCAPRAFEIKGFLSDIEVDHILEVVRTKHLERSSTDGGVAETRTSRTTWIDRSTDAILDTVFKRAADVLHINEALLRKRLPDEEYLLPESVDGLNEELQIVHYDVGQEYTAHHDFGFPETPDPNFASRSINVALYLNTVEKGGETTFPRWRNAETSDGIKVKPEKGKAMLFYMINPDGNLDDLTQHAALPVLKGEKFFANLWIHDPFRD